MTDARRRRAGPPPPIPARLRGIALLVVAGSLLLGARLGYLQVARGENLRRASEENRIHQRAIVPPRGLILDRRGEVLATTRPAYDVSFVPLGVARDSYPAIAATLARVIGGSPDSYLAALKEAARRPYLALPVAHDVSRGAVARLAERRADLPGIVVDVRTARAYPLGTVAGHLLGYVAEASRADLARDPWYAPGDRKGVAGVEALLETDLRGAKGWEEVEVDALGHPLRRLARRAATPGARAVLTIDADIQRWAAEALGDRSGAVVVLEPATGRVLALVSSPSFDPGAFADRARTRERLALLADTSLPLLYRPLQSLYAPGSTFKIVTLAAGLASGRLTPATRFACAGTYAGQKCWILEKKHRGHGTLDLVEALANSCNVYFYQAGERIGIAPIASTARGLGLGVPPGVGIGPEAAGVVPTPEWERENVAGPDGEHWGLGDVRNTAIGQGYVVASPFQLARMAGAAAYGGVLMRPRIVERLETDDGRILRAFEPEVEADLGWDSSVASTVREALAAVVERGTGAGARLPGVRVGGKTGTAQNPHGEDHAWFVAVAPVDSPAVSIAVLVEHGGGGSAAALPVARSVLERLAAREGWTR